MFLGSVHLLWYDETIQFNFSEANDLSDGKKIFKMCQLFRKHYKSTIQFFFIKDSNNYYFELRGYIGYQLIINCTINQSTVFSSKKFKGASNIYWIGHSFFVEIFSELRNQSLLAVIVKSLRLKLHWDRFERHSSKEYIETKTFF